MNTACRYRRAFTLIEVVVVIICLGILSGIGGLGYRAYMQRAELEATRTQVASIVDTTLAYAAANNHLTLSRADILAAITGIADEGADGTVEGAVWVLLAGGNRTPAAGSNEIAVAFDGALDGSKISADCPTSTGEPCGTRMVVLAQAKGGQMVATVATIEGRGEVDTVDATTPEDVLAGQTRQ